MFRVENLKLTEVLQDIGGEGYYIEPRSPDGRAPCDNFRVIWLNKSDRQASVLASQSTQQWNSIVRSGIRFGLRVLQEHAREVHQQHKPMTPFLESDDILIFRVGPFPHGANRACPNKGFSAVGLASTPKSA